MTVALVGRESKSTWGRVKAYPCGSLIGHCPTRVPKHLESDEYVKDPPTTGPTNKPDWAKSSLLHQLFFTTAVKGIAGNARKF